MSVQADGSATPSRPSAAGLVLWTLTAVYVLNFLDRSLLGVLAKPIEESLHIDDKQLGMIGGLYFALFYCFIAVPIGWFADRTNRVNVLSLACAIWSGATAACGFAVSYPQLVIARMTVGFGEAGGVPPSYAIITDTIPPGRRGVAFGFYNMGPALGAALGVAFGASIAAAFNWRDAFIGIGVIGIVAAIAIKLLIREPTRGAFDTGHDNTEKAAFGPTMTMFFSRPTLLLMALGSGATQFVTYGLGNFTPLFLGREKGMSLQQIAIWYALVIIAGMGAGMLVSGRVIDRYTRVTKAAYAAVPAVSLVFALPCYLLFVWASAWQVSLLFLTAAMFLNYFYLSSAIALVQEEVRPDQRVLSSALLLLVMNFIGLGLGPTWVGAASKYFTDHGSPHGLQIALYTLAPFYLIAIVIFLWLAARLRAESRSIGANS